MSGVSGKPPHAVASPRRLSSELTDDIRAHQ